MYTIYPKNIIEKPKEHKTAPVQLVNIRILIDYAQKPPRTFETLNNLLELGTPANFILVTVNVLSQAKIYQPWTKKWGCFNSSHLLINCVNVAGNVGT